MNILHDASRRLFLRKSAALSALVGSAAPLALNLSAMGSAAAQAAPDYRAIVCLFLYGGNDAFNMVLPTDAASWNAYTSTRTQAPDPIALLAPGTAANAAAAAGSPARLGGVLPIAPRNPQGRSFALHPSLSALQTLFDTDKRLAILPNIGPLIMPTTKAQYAQSTYPKPARLFSHNDQQNTWQALGPEGATRGWGGRLGDLLASSNSPALFTAISAAGNAVFLDGETVRQYGVSTNGPTRVGLDANGRVYGSADVGAALQRLVTTSRTTHPFDTDLAAAGRRTFSAEEALRTALRAPSEAPFGTAPASGAYNVANDPKLRFLNPVTGAEAANGLAQQFQVVARLIDAGLRGASGAKRQVFFVSLGGFDTHDLQNRNQAVLFAQLAQALRYFDQTLAALGALEQVTTFTASDFGRTFTSNGDGTDHGWGSHHFVMGGAVRGGDLYGAFPMLGLKNASNSNFDSSPDQLGNGSLLPKTSVDQLGATLAQWFGVSASDALTVFPNLANFGQRNLGFFG
ncbi:DUF1501 domain-containing protein [Piscinibacter koreensis]|uniref:DUF1501 domain-containing protein n=1 Tax=Piscinibacter koreensis TaxID=2742824 RepID=A0A7Y6TX88_9BURK|nr:DUF1501 domain-containing protein [Schlegelella koreensis]NUZ06889.1 DUF1501 domain-containing protein [Schlegelella koreensis]